MTTTVTITERRGDTAPTATVRDTCEVVLVRDGAISRRTETRRGDVPTRDVLASVTMREWLDGDLEGDESDLNTAVACTVEDGDDGEVLVPFSVNR